MEVAEAVCEGATPLEALSRVDELPPGGFGRDDRSEITFRLGHSGDVLAIETDDAVDGGVNVSTEGLPFASGIAVGGDPLGFGSSEGVGFELGVDLGGGLFHATVLLRGSILDALNSKRRCLDSRR